MKDREFLIWLHNRLELEHNESPCVAHMHKLRAIIGSTNKDQLTPNVGTGNSLEGFMRELRVREGSYEQCTNT